MNKQYHPHKVFKFCPKCGGSNLRANCSKSLTCNDCHFVYYTNSAGAVGAIIKNNEDEILLTTRAFDPGKGLLDLPGGFVDPGETAETCLHREIKEELNLDILDYKYFASFPNEYVYKDILYFTIDMIFECTVKTFEGIQVDDDVTDYAFYKIDDSIIQKVGLKSIKQILSEYKK